MRTPGIYDGIPASEYHGGPELSASGAKVLLKAPAKYRYRQDHPQHKDAYDKGTVTHTLTLGEGDEYEVIDGGAGKSKRQEAARAAGKTPITMDDYEAARAMADAVKAHPLAAGILSAGAAERSIYWTDQATGVHCRARADWLRPEMVADLKTTSHDADPRSWGSTVVNFGYDLAAAAYLEGLTAVGESCAYAWLVVETEAPHLVAVHQATDEQIERGSRLWRDALTLYARCLEANDWPGYGSDFLTPIQPRWAA